MNQEAEKSLFWYRVKLLALVAVFLSPFIGGWLALYVFELRPESGNYGTLIQPVRKIDWPGMTAVDGTRHEQGFGRKWTLVLFSGRSCGETCRQNLYYMRQLRTLLGRDTQRLQNLMIAARPLTPELRDYLADYPSLVVVENNADRGLYDQFELADEAAVGDTPMLYLIDPDRNLMMYYPAESDHDRMLEDIKKLMKLSKIG